MVLPAMIATLLAAIASGKRSVDVLFDRRPTHEWRGHKGGAGKVGKVQTLVGGEEKE